MSVAISSIFAIVNRIRVLVNRLFLLQVAGWLMSLFVAFPLVLECRTCS